MTHKTPENLPREPLKGHYGLVNEASWKQKDEVTKENEQDDPRRGYDRGGRRKDERTLVSIAFPCSDVIRS